MDLSDAHIVCEYCGTSVPVDSAMIHIGACCLDSSQNYDDHRGILRCYSCGSQKNPIPNDQKRYDDLARCVECVAKNRMCKAEPFRHSARWGPNIAQHRLYSAVWSMEIDLVSSLIQEGADVNGRCQATARFPDDVIRVLYTSKNTPILDMREDAPNTPLKACVSRFSGSGVGDVERERILRTVSLLIAYSAETVEAYDYFVELYGDSHSPGSQWDRMLMMLGSGIYET